MTELYDLKEADIKRRLEKMAKDHGIEGVVRINEDNKVEYAPESIKQYFDDK